LQACNVIRLLLHAIGTVCSFRFGAVEIVDHHGRCQTGRGQPAAIGAEGQFMNRAGMAHPANLAIRLQVPKIDRFIVSGVRRNPSVESNRPRAVTGEDSEFILAWRWAERRTFDALNLLASRRIKDEDWAGCLEARRNAKRVKHGRMLLKDQPSPAV